MSSIPDDDVHVSIPDLPLTPAADVHGSIPDVSPKPGADVHGSADSQKVNYVILDIEGLKGHLKN